MTTLAKNLPRPFYQGDFIDFPVIAADIIYAGAAVGDNGSGYARPLQAGDPFRGFADTQADNSAGTAGAVTVRTRVRGAVELAISSLAITDVGAAVYASDDNTFTLTASTNTHIGRVVRWLETGKGIVEFDATRGGVGLVGELTDSTTGTANATVAAVADIALSTSDTYTDAAVNAAVNTAIATVNDDLADLTAKVNALARQVG